MAGGYLLTEDAVRDLAELEDFAASYAGDESVERLEGDFFDLFEHLVYEAHGHPLWEPEEEADLLHEYRSVNLYHYKVFYYMRDEDDTVIIYRMRHLASDFTRVSWLTEESCNGR